jgi:hypothetical protein
MAQSTEIKDLLAALHTASAAMPNPQKNAKNEHFRNRYADLGAVLECIEQPLMQNGLVLTQMLDTAGPLPVLTTTLWHAPSGQWIAGQVPLIAEKAGPQALGSAITYMRRYAIKSLFAMADQDDDAEGASSRPTKAAKFDFVEEALEASKKIASYADIMPWWDRVRASGFKGSDYKAAHDRAADLGKQFPKEK